MKFYHLKWFVRAVIEDPKGLFCSTCGKINLFFDDIGWWYKDGTLPVCKKCMPTYYGER